MATDQSKIQELLVSVKEHEIRLNRHDSDFESEKDTRKERNTVIDQRLMDIERWKNNLNGKIKISETIAKLGWGLFASLLVAVIIWFLNNKK